MTGSRDRTVKEWDLDRAYCEARPRTAPAPAPPPLDPPSPAPCIPAPPSMLGHGDPDLLSGSESKIHRRLG